MECGNYPASYSGRREYLRRLAKRMGFPTEHVKYCNKKIFIEIGGETISVNGRIYYRWSLGAPDKIEVYPEAFNYDDRVEFTLAHEVAHHKQKELYYKDYWMDFFILNNDSFQDLSNNADFFPNTAAYWRGWKLGTNDLSTAVMEGIADISGLDYIGHINKVPLIWLNLYNTINQDYTRLIDLHRGVAWLND